MDARLLPISGDAISLIHPAARTSVFWELEPDLATNVVDVAFEKEAWLSMTLVDYGQCGFNIGFPDDRPARATILYCSADRAPGATRMPSGPVSDDADIITSLFVDPGFEGIGMEALLLDASIMHLLQHSATAVEAFGLRESHPEPTGDVASIVAEADTIGLLKESGLQSAGFHVVRDHPVLPRLRLDLPPAHGLLSAAAIEKLLDDVTTVAVRS